LPNANPDIIEEEVRRTIQVLAPGGGYVFVPTHNIQPDVTPDRLDRVYQAALKYRSYPVTGHEENFKESYYESD
jgi:uroporphyrinogen decarboxylase